MLMQYILPIIMTILNDQLFSSLANHLMNLSRSVLAVVWWQLTRADKVCEWWIWIWIGLQFPWGKGNFKFPHIFMLLIWLEGTYCFRLYNNDEIFLQNLFNKLKFRILPEPERALRNNENFCGWNIILYKGWNRNLW